MDEHTNSLSNEEQQQLRELETNLERHDPKFAALFGPPSLRRARARLVRQRRGIGLFLGLAVGLTALMTGVAVASPLIGIVGFAVTVAALHAVVPNDGLFADSVSKIGHRRTEHH